MPSLPRRIALGVLAIVASLAGASVAMASSRVAPRATLTQAPVNAAKTPVVFVALDEFSLGALLSAPGRIDERRFPNFAALARQSTWFANATASADGTRWAAPAVFAGARPDRRRISIASDYPASVFTMLGRTHRLFVEEPLTRLCPVSLCPANRLAARTRRQKSAALNVLIRRQKRDALRRSALADFIGRLQPWTSGKPPFYFIHALMPHHPWLRMPDGHRYTPPVPEIPQLHGDNLWRNDQPVVDRNWQRYLLQVGYTDMLVGRLMSRMKATGLWDRALLVLTPDHGVSFVAGRSRRTADRATIGGIGPIPVFIKRPGQSLGSRVDKHMETIDVLPTAADALELPIPRALAGRSALDPGFKPSPRAELWSTTSTRTFGRHTYPMTLVTRRLREVIARQASLFGTGPFSGRFFTPGPGSALVGRSAARLPAGSRPVRFAPDGPVAGAPAFVSGELRGMRVARTLAVAVGGRVVTTTRSYVFGGRGRFAAVLPRAGPVRVYTVG